MCFGPSTLGAGAKTRLESRIKKFTPHCGCRPLLAGSSEFDHLHQIHRLLGDLPRDVLSRSLKYMDFYDISGTPARGQTYVTWRASNNK